MFALTNPEFKPVKGAKRRGYDVGFARGMFDKCNGVPAKALDKIADTKYNRGYTSGYLDGFCSNEVMV